MFTHSENLQVDKNQSVAGPFTGETDSGERTFGFEDLRPVAITQRKLQEIADNSPQVLQSKAYYQIANGVEMTIQRQVVQRQGGNGEDGQEGSEGEEEEEQDLPAAVGDVATVVGLISGQDSGLGEAMGVLGDLAEGAGGARDAVSGDQMLNRLTGAAKAVNTVAGVFVQSVPFVGQAASAVELAQIALRKRPAAQSEYSAAKEDVDNPDLEMGRSQQEREERLASAEGALNETFTEGAEKAGGVTGVPLADKMASYAATAYTQGPMASVGKAQEDATKTATTLFNVAQYSVRTLYNNVASRFLPAGQDDDAGAPDDDMLDRMERGELG